MGQVKDVNITQINATLLTLVLLDLSTELTIRLLK